jgi:hypoxanthine phosphoribosyltransferase
MNKRNISFDQLKGHCHEIIRQMGKDEFRPELIIGITRGGALPAVLISQYLNVKMVGLDVSLRDNAGYGQESNCWAAEDAMAGQKILIVDDINDTGATFNWILKDWDITGNAINWGDNVRFAVIVDNAASDAKHPPEYVGLEINKTENPEWVIFPYEDWWK